MKQALFGIIFWGTLINSSLAVAQITRNTGDTIKKSPYVTEATSPAGIKKHVRANLDEASVRIGTGLVFFTGVYDAPFAMGVGADIGLIKPLGKKHFAAECLLNIDYCFDPSRKWYARSVSTTPDNITKMSGGCNIGLGFAVSAILVNTHRLSVIAGPEFSLQNIYLSEIVLKTGDIGLRDQVLLSYAPGIKAAAYLGDRLIINLEYIYCLRTQVDYDPLAYQSTAISIPIDLKLLRVGVGCRL